MTGTATLSALVLAGALVGCAKASDEAKDTFSHDLTCPKDSVEVRAREDLLPSRWRGIPTPNAEIAADPARLAMWNKEHEKARTSDDDRHHIYEARGCGHEVLYECAHTTGKSSTPYMCMDREYPAGVAKW